MIKFPFKVTFLDPHSTAGCALNTLFGFSRRSSFEMFRSWDANTIFTDVLARRWVWVSYSALWGPPAYVCFLSVHFLSCAEFKVFQTYNISMGGGCFLISEKPSPIFYLLKPIISYSATLSHRNTPFPRPYLDLSFELLETYRPEHASRHRNEPPWFSSCHQWIS